MVDSKKAMVEKLREDLDKAEMALMLSKRREATLKEKLHFTQRDLEEAKQQLSSIEG